MHVVAGRRMARSSAAGPAEFYALDIIETIRHGLIGGGKGVVNGEEVKVTPAAIATKLVDTYVLGRPLKPNWERRSRSSAPASWDTTRQKKTSPPKSGRRKRTKEDGYLDYG
jgi:hypothetical protein